MRQIQAKSVRRGDVVCIDARVGKVDEICTRCDEVTLFLFLEGEEDPCEVYVTERVGLIKLKSEAYDPDAILEPVD